MSDGRNSGPFGIPPGGPYFVGPTGTIQRQDNRLLAQGLASAGWVGFPTFAAAKNYASHGGIAAQTNKAVNSAEGAVTSTADFLSRLTAPATWIRVAEVGLGLILIAVGIAKLTNAIPVATKVAAKVAKVGEVAAIA